MEILESPQNKLVKRLISYSHKKGREADGVFIAEGLRFVLEIPLDWEVVCYGFRQDFSQDNFFLQAQKRAKCYVFSERVFNMIAQTQSPQGIFAVCRQKKWSIETLFQTEKPGFYILAENLNDPGNLGTIIRTADAGNVDGILLSKGSVELYNPKVLRATMGSLFHLPIIENVDIPYALKLCQSKGILTLAAHLQAKAYPYAIDMKKPVAILIGNEAKGITEETASLCAQLVKIPMPGRAESLNASMAAGILIYEGVRQRNEI